MKKFFSFILCIVLSLSFVSCKKDKSLQDDVKLKDIPASTADVEDENADDAKEDIDTSDRTEETDRKEIENNLRDARDLIEIGAIEDASMIIKGLQTRDLTADERAELKELQAMMIKVSD